MTVKKRKSMKMIQQILYEYISEPLEVLQARLRSGMRGRRAHKII